MACRQCSWALHQEQGDHPGPPLARPSPLVRQRAHLSSPSHSSPSDRFKPAYILTAGKWSGLGHSLLLLT